jgi:hypothetical protein
MENQKPSIGNIVAISLILFLVGSLIFLFLRISDDDTENKKETIESVVKEEPVKEEVKKKNLFNIGGGDEGETINKSLDSLIIKYNQAIEMKTSISGELAEERKRILILRDSITALKSEDYVSIKGLADKVRAFEMKNKELIAQNKSLNKEKKRLTSKLNASNSELEDANEEIDTFRTTVKDLNVKVSKAARIRIFKGNIYAMRRKRNGQYLETRHAKKTSAFRINFSLEANQLANQGERRVYLQIADDNERIISQIGSFTLENGKEIPFSDFIDANYTNSKQRELVSLVEVNPNILKKGIYVANVFIENYYAGSIEINMK